MKKADVLQLAIMLVGIILGFITLQFIFSALFGILAWLFTGGYAAENYLTPGMAAYVTILLQGLCSWLLITKSGSLAAYFYERSNLGTGFKIVSNIQSLLYIILVAIAIYLLISNLTPLISAVFKSFKEKATSNNFAQEDQRPVEWAGLFINILLPCLLLFFAKPIASFFAKNVNEEPLSIEDSFNVENSGS